MIIIMTRVAAVCALLSPLVLQAQPAAAVEDLRWLSGCWQSESGSRTTQEQWMAPAGGTMLGMSRSVSGGRTVAYEFIQIREQEGGVFYVARPSGQAETAFRLVRVAPNEAVFENPEHDFPQRVIYRLGADGNLAARIEGMREGKLQGVDFPMLRTTCP